MENQEPKLESEDTFKLTIEPLSQPLRAIFEDLSYTEFRKMFDDYWHENHQILTTRFPLKIRKKKKKGNIGGKAMLEKNHGFKKLYGEIIVDWAVEKLNNVMYVKGFDLYNFEMDKKPVLVVLFFESPELVIENELNFEVQRPKMGDDEVQWEQQCKIVQAQHRTLKPYEGDDIKEDHNILIDIIAEIDGEPSEQETVRKRWIEISKHWSDEFREQVLKHKKGELFEVSWDKDGKTVNAQVKIHDLQVVEYPDIDDELAKDEKYESLADMKAKFLEDYHKQIENTERGIAIDHVIGQISENSKIPPVPEEWIDINATKSMQAHIQRFKGNTRQAMMSIGAVDEPQMLSMFKGHVLQDSIKRMATRAYVDKYDLDKDDEEKIAEHIMSQIVWLD